MARIRKTEARRLDKTNINNLERKYMLYISISFFHLLISNFILSSGVALNEIAHRNCWRIKTGLLKTKAFFEKCVNANPIYIINFFDRKLVICSSLRWNEGNCATNFVDLIGRLTVKRVGSKAGRKWKEANCFIRAIILIRMGGGGGAVPGTTVDLSISSSDKANVSPCWNVPTL